MAIANTRSRYGTVAMTLHWLIALAVLTNICLGLYHADFIPDNAPPDMQKFAFQIIQLHKSHACCGGWSILSRHCPTE